MHTMTLQPTPFSRMKYGLKTVEVRVFDEKRSNVAVGDDVTFKLATDPAQVIVTRVVGLTRYATFQELFSAVPRSTLGMKAEEEWQGVYQYYTKEEEQEKGVLAIKVAVLSFA